MRGLAALAQNSQVLSMVDYVVPHRPDWKHAFHREATALQGRLRGVDLTLHHIGSTAVAGILAKPIIDLLGVVPRLADIDTHKAVFEALGYEVMGAYGIEGRRYFRKVSSAGKRTHHLHIYQTGSAHIERHLAFRDYLRCHPDKAQAYSDLKARLASADDATWDAYLDGKEPFILVTECEALAWFRSL